jgi:hypothetical protein
MECVDLLQRVPDYREFLTLDELHHSSLRLVEAFPTIARLEVIGTSTEGRAIELLTIGHGRQHALLLGAPHPNEPVGTLTLEFLARLLCERDDLRRAFDVTWLMVKAADPDGLVLNEGWLKGPFSPLKYALHYYCPPHQEQVEWGFPIQYKSLRFAAPPAETRAVMALMERYRPTFFASLHNAGFCGVYFYLSQRRPALFQALQRLVAAAQLPLHRGEPEVPYLQAWDTAVYPLFGARETYDFLERSLGEDPAPLIVSGTSSSDYLAQRVPEALSLVCEVPYYTDPALADDTPAGVSRRDALAAGLARAERIFRTVEAHFLALQDRLPPDRLYRAVADYVRRTPKRLAAQRHALQAPPYAQEATRAQAFDAMVCRSFYPARYLGILARLADAVGEVDRAEELRRQLAELMAGIEAESHLQILPLRQLVAVQAGSCLLAMGLRTA